MASIYNYNGFGEGKKGYRAQVNVNGKRITKTFTNKATAKKWVSHLEVMKESSSGTILISKQIYVLLKSFLNTCKSDDDIDKCEAKNILLELNKFNIGSVK